MRRTVVDGVNLVNDPNSPAARGYLGHHPGLLGPSKNLASSEVLESDRNTYI